MKRYIVDLFKEGNGWVSSKIDATIGPDWEFDSKKDAITYCIIKQKEHDDTEKSHYGVIDTVLGCEVFCGKTMRERKIITGATASGSM